jgi:hypothetical protein
MITLRKTTIEDIPTLLNWGKQDHAMFATGNDSHELANSEYWEEELALCDGVTYQYYIAELDSIPIADIQIINPGLEQTHY